MTGQSLFTKSLVFLIGVHDSLRLIRTAKGGLKIHTCWDDSLALPDLVNITPARNHDVKGHPQSIFPKGTIVIEDRGYFDFSLMAARCAADNYFVTRIKDNTVYEVLCQRTLPQGGEDQHILKDEEIMVTSANAHQSGMGLYALRRVVVYDQQNERTIEVLTNHFEWKAATVAALYKKRWVPNNGKSLPVPCRTRE